MSVPGFDQSFNGRDDAFLVKLAPSGTSLVYATYLGGSNQETGESVAVDSSGAAYVSGFTTSSETSFPDGPVSPRFTCRASIRASTVTWMSSW